jgi:hypothetical protein
MRVEELVFDLVKNREEVVTAGLTWLRSVDCIFIYSYLNDQMNHKLNARENCKRTLICLPLVVDGAFEC